MQNQQGGGNAYNVMAETTIRLKYAFITSGAVETANKNRKKIVLIDEQTINTKNSHEVIYNRQFVFRK